MVQHITKQWFNQSTKLWNNILASFSCNFFWYHNLVKPRTKFFTVYISRNFWYSELPFLISILE
ncbi:hypothetical protein X975_05173, partial [Stegodyphus mimosarum]